MLRDMGSLITYQTTNQEQMDRIFDDRKDRRPILMDRTKKDRSPTLLERTFILHTEDIRGPIMLLMDT